MFWKFVTILVLLGTFSVFANSRVERSEVPRLRARISALEASLASANEQAGAFKNALAVAENKLHPTTAPTTAPATTQPVEVANK
jgi:hypothetical protein